MKADRPRLDLRHTQQHEQQQSRLITITTNTMILSMHELST
jgi:hypothetical protein